MKQETFLQQKCNSFELTNHNARSNLYMKLNSWLKIFYCKMVNLNYFLALSFVS